MHIALFEPEIPPNTGNISRLSVLTNTNLHIIGKPSFSLDEKAVKRAGLDYWDQLDLHQHKNWAEFQNSKQILGCRVFLVSRFAKTVYTDISYKEDDVLVFGNESSGLPDSIVNEMKDNNPENIIRIPVKAGVRSLNLSNAVSIILFEALRQNDFEGLEKVYIDSK